MVKSLGFVFNYLCFLITSIEFIISSWVFYFSLWKTDSFYGCAVVLLSLYTWLSLFPVLTNEFVSIWSGCRELESCNKKKKSTFNACTIENLMIEHLMTRVQTRFQVNKKLNSGCWLVNTMQISHYPPVPSNALAGILFRNDRNKCLLSLQPRFTALSQATGYCITFPTCQHPENIRNREWRG